MLVTTLFDTKTEEVLMYFISYWKAKEAQIDSLHLKSTPKKLEIILVSGK